jgi:hypothetical protein
MKFNDFSALLTELLRRNKISRIDCMARKNLLQCGMGAAATAGLRALYTIDEAHECYWLKDYLPYSGRIAYEADCKNRPTYHDGTTRKTWEKLGSLGQWSWSRPEKFHSA